MNFYLKEGYYIKKYFFFLNKYKKIFIKLFFYKKDVCNKVLYKL